MLNRKVAFLILMTTFFHLVIIVYYTIIYIMFYGVICNFLGILEDKMTTKRISLRC